MLELRDIRKEYKTGDFVQKALDGVSLSLRENEFVAVLGPSGSGKTTLLNIIGGLDRYDSGDLLIDGISTKEYKDRDWDTYRNHSVGFVFQNYNLIPHQTILKNVQLALTIAGIGNQEGAQRAQEVLEAVGLGDQSHKKPGELSGGQMQRVAIARALVNDPDILLADEPTGALDSTTSLQVMDLLKEVARERLVVMVTHNPELAEKYANRIVNLKDGRIVGDSNPYTPAAADEETAVEPVGAAAAGETTDEPPVTAAAAAGAADAAAAPKKRRASMSFKTALGLSGNNLLTKKARTILIAIAGSIGIIGIALIQALSNGVNRYIDDIERETLTQYPLQIEESAFDFTSMLGASNTPKEDKEKKDSEKKEAEVEEYQTMTGMFSQMNSNDLTSLKGFLDSKDSNIDRYATAVQYNYHIDPQIYRKTTEEEKKSGAKRAYRKVNPDSTFTSMGIGAEVSQNPMISAMMSSNTFYQLPDNEKLYKSQYELCAGDWPKRYNEMVVVLYNDNKLNDLTLASMGLKDAAELDQAVKDFVAGKDIDMDTTIHSYEYQDLMDVSFKLVNNASLYSYDRDLKLWKDISSDGGKADKLAEDGEDLVISGIIRPKKGAKVLMLQNTIYYSPRLVDHIREVSAESEIVKDQRKDPDKNVFTGNSFDDDKSTMDMSKLFSVDGDAMTRAFNFDQSKLKMDPNAFGNFDMSKVNVSSILKGAQKKNSDKEMNKLLNDLLSGFRAYTKDKPGADIDKLRSGIAQYMRSDAGQQIILDNVQDAFKDKDGDGVPEFDGDAVNYEAMGQALAAGYPAYAKANGLTNPDDTTKELRNYLSSDAATKLIMASFGNIYDMDKISSNLSKELGRVIGSQLNSSMKNLGASISNAMSFDPDAFTNAIKFKMTEKELQAMMSSLMSAETASYDDNLKKMGYAEEDRPEEILIFPKDFESKDQIVKIIDRYNKRMEKAGEDDKVISYTDIVGVMMNSVTDIINAISYMLIAFVSISLVVSSIMIGVITYISVLERKKEIGILRAMGASKRNVGNVFNAETVIIGALAGLFGVAIARLLLFPADAIIQHATNGVNLHPYLKFSTIAALILLSIALTLIGGFIPSRKASRSDPVVALRET